MESMTSLKLSHKQQKLLKKSQHFGWSLFRSLLLLGLSFILLYPLMYMISIAFRSMADVYNPAVVWVPEHFSVENITSALKYMKYWKALGVTVEVNVVSALFQVASCAVTGYAFARFKFPYKNILFGILVFSMIVPPQLLITPLFLGFKTVSLLNTPFPFYLMSLTGNGIKSGLVIFLFRQFFRGMPKELEDASAIDGCGFFSCFYKIMLPNSIPVIITSLVLSIVWYWNDYYIGSMLLSNHQTVTLELVRLPSALRLGSGYTVTDPYKFITSMQAGSLLTILPVLIFYLIIQRYFIQSVERSGIVG